MFRFLSTVSMLITACLLFTLMYFQIDLMQANQAAAQPTRPQQPVRQPRETRFQYVIIAIEGDDIDLYGPFHSYTDAYEWKVQADADDIGWTEIRCYSANLGNCDDRYFNVGLSEQDRIVLHGPYVNHDVALECGYNIRACTLEKTRVCKLKRID